ncbi:MAG: GPR endopeptidase [Clostridia bacterium]|nr:GPR endopeptidase [Clostridia bacterium]
MISENFITDIALESAESANLHSRLEQEILSFGISKKRLNIRTKEMSEQTGKPLGVYVSFDCDKRIFMSPRAGKAVETNICETLYQLIGVRPKSKPVLVACLGNGNITSDSLGDRVFDKLKIDADKNAKNGDKQPVLAISTSVFGKTGIQSAQIVRAICKEISPSCVVLVDSLATSVPKRVGLSFQLSTAGITPGSGVYGGKERIDKSVLGVPTVSIGVPTLLSLGTMLHGVFADYMQKIGRELDEYKYRELLASNMLSNMVVAPKDVDVYVENASVIIANAINSAFNMS